MNTTFKNKAAIFRIIPRNMFAAQYEEAFEAVENDELDLEIEEPFTYGEVKLPGQGKRGCLVMSSTKKPGWFYDDFDGWNRVPSGETFIEVTSTVQGTMGSPVAPWTVASTGKPRAARLNPRGLMVVYHL